MRILLAGVVALTAGACAVEESSTELETAEIEQSEAALINGSAAIDSRPEVGVFVPNNNVATIPTCTATLIAPQYFVMAAHCTGYNAVQTGGALRLKLPGNVNETSFTVDRVFGFGGNPNIFAAQPANGIGKHDLALGRLSAPITNFNGFSPAPIAAAQVANGVTVTLMGAGCTVRDGNNLANGVKRFVTATHPNGFGFTNNLCGGDSGGPVFAGTLAANGNLVAVNSGFGGSPTRDVFADITYFKARLEVFMRSLDNEIEIADRSGFDIDMASNVADVASCALHCTNHNDCMLYTYDSTTKQCWRKRAVANPSGTNPTKFSGLRPQFEYFTDRPGNDLPNVPNIDTPAQCQAECARNQNCHAFTHVLNTRTCWLKNYASNKVTTNSCATSWNCTSGIRRHNEDGVTRLGSVVVAATSQQSNATACAFACANRATCQSWTWSSDTNTCSLMDRVGNPVVAVQPAVSGVRGGLEINIDRPGNDLPNQPIVLSPAEPAPERCQTLCNQTTACRAWTMTTWSSPHGGDSPRCWLHSAIGTPQTSNGAVSGVKYMDVFDGR